MSAALRETKEELGIDLNPQNGMLFCSTPQKWEDGHTAFVDVWVFEYNEPVENIAFDEREVCDAMWASVDKIKEMMAAGEFLDYPYFDEMVEQQRAAFPASHRHGKGVGWYDR